jgi:hypothetical protein
MKCENCGNALESEGFCSKKCHDELLGSLFPRNELLQIPIKTNTSYVRDVVICECGFSGKYVDLVMFEGALSCPSCRGLRWNLVRGKKMKFIKDAFLKIGVLISRFEDKVIALILEWLMRDGRKKMPEITAEDFYDGVSGRLP